ncbi:uncharacterized protein N7496_000399 [Penicillium cataractarum]|uniref:F-box domain-containing protein n=1 Tax=Penicillium cataractarum TaxID=2100454 RepID=A0A9X0B600_9EURO|nr:uncharacterized protein N7496_000399 [Penicillium cataractarum]KAJ5389331.1 hypothetical protein N7496_000399 [Penicillium cataractarum]
MLLNLPTELVQLILRSCDTPTYLQLALSCRSIYEMATKSRELVLHQLHQTPGCTDDIDTLPIQDLVKLLKKHSHQELFGSEHFTNRKLIDFQGKKLDTRASSLEAPVLRNRALLAFQGDETVYFVDIRAGTVSLRRRLESPAKQFGTIQVLRTAFNSSGAYVLHRFQPFADKQLDTTHPFVQQAMQSYPQGSVFLAYYSFDSPTDAVRLYDFHDEQEYDPIAIAAHRDEKFAISWQHRQRAQDHHVLIYLMEDPDEDEDEDEDDEDDDENEDEDDDEDEEVDDEDEEIEQEEENNGEHEASGQPQTVSNIICSSYDCYALTEMNDGRSSDAALIGKGPTAKLVFNDRGFQMLHHYRAHTLFSSFQKLHSIPGIPEPAVRNNSCLVPYSPLLMLQFAIGIPFFATHRNGTDSPVPGTCHWQYLTVGIATHRVEHWTVACLLKSESNPQAFRCDHVMNLDRGRRFDHWTAVAQLGGYEESNTSEGSLIAASPLGTRIAIASWKTVTVWALEPRVLVDEEDGYYPESWTNSAGLTELRPAAIQLNAVCLQMKFTENEHELAVITDCGLILLDIRPSGGGVKVVERRTL